MARLLTLALPLLVALAGAARADAPRVEGPTVALAATGAAEAPDTDALRSDEAQVERLRRRARWLGALGVASATLAVGSFTALGFSPDYPLFETFAGIGGVAAVTSAAFFGAWVAMRTRIRGAEHTLAGTSEEWSVQIATRRRRLLRAGWPMVGAGCLLAVIGVASMGDDTSDAAAGRALARAAGLGAVGGALVVVGLPLAIRGHTLRTRLDLSVVVGPGSLALTASF